MPACLKPRAPPPRNHKEESHVDAAGHRRVARDELSAKKMGFVPVELPNPDAALMLRKRLREEMEALRGILKKAELLAGKNVGNNRAAPRRGKNGCFLAAEAHPAATEADRPTNAKRRKTTPVAAVVKPRMSADEISNLSSRLALLSEDMPAHILEFLKKECTGHGDRSRGEIVIDIASMRQSAMFDLKKLLDEFDEGEKRRRQDEASTNASKSTSCSSPRQHEDGEIVEGEGYDVAIGTRRYASPVSAVSKVLCSPAKILEDGEIAEEEAMCVDAAPVATEKFAETTNSPSTNSSSSSGSSSSSSDSSDSDSSDSDSDDESVTSTPAPAPAVPHKTEATPMAVQHKAQRSSPCSSSVLEDGEVEEGECCGASAAQPEKLAEDVNSPRNSYSPGSYYDISFRGGPAPDVLSKPLKRQPPAQDRQLPPSQAEYRDLIAKGLQMQRRLRNSKRQRAYEQLEEMERKATPINDWIHPMHLRQLGIKEYAVTVTFEQRVSDRGSPVQRLLGLFLKAE